MVYFPREITTRPVKQAYQRQMQRQARGHAAPNKDPLAMAPVFDIKFTHLFLRGANVVYFLNGKIA
jgi:hypothetical protein